VTAKIKKMSRTQQMKRRAPYTTVTTTQFKRPRVNYATRFVVAAPRRAYPVSRVPLASRGYRPNTVERKVNDLDTTTYQVNTSGSFTLLANPQVGADMNNRIGRKITLKSVYVKGRVQLELAGSLVAAASGAQQARMIIFSDMQPNGSAPVVTDLLVSATPASQLNLNNRDRFRVYCDKEYVFDPMLVTATLYTWNRTIQLVKKFKALNLEMVFSTSTGSIADITTGALYMFWIGSAAPGTNTDANFVGSTRVRYTDN